MDGFSPPGWFGIPSICLVLPDWEERTGVPAERWHVPLWSCVHTCWHQPGVLVRPPGRTGLRGVAVHGLQAGGPLLPRATVVGSQHPMLHVTSGQNVPPASSCWPEEDRRGDTFRVLPGLPWKRPQNHTDFIWATFMGSSLQWGPSGAASILEVTQQRLSFLAGGRSPSSSLLCACSVLQPCSGHTPSPAIPESSLVSESCWCWQLSPSHPPPGAPSSPAAALLTVPLPSASALLSLPPGSLPWQCPVALGALGYSPSAILASLQHVSTGQRPSGCCQIRHQRERSPPGPAASPGAALCPPFPEASSAESGSKS